MHASTYGDAELAVLEILGLEPLSSPAFWAKLTEADAPELFELRKSIRFAVEYLPKLLRLIEQEFVQEARNQDSTTPQLLSGKSLLTVILVEDKGQFSAPERLVYALDSVSSLYAVVATLEGQSESDLAVLACDSGSDKSFDFLGLAKLMEEVRKIIISIWDRRVFHRQMHVSQCIALIADSLPVIERIHAMKQSGAIGPEQAELLKRKTIDGATRFLESGAVIPEMERESSQSPRLLMRPEPKLLTGPTERPSPGLDADSNGTVTDADSEGGMTDSDLEELERLVSKARGAQKKPRPPRKKDA